MKNPDQTRTDRPSEEAAQELAVSILTWLTAQPQLMSRFLAISGIEAGGIRQAAGEPGFFGGVTAFLMNHEPTLLAFCQENDVKVEWVQACHQRLTGPSEGIWL